MNTRLDDLFARRSMRRFTGESLSNTAIQDLLDAAMAAPSAGAKDPWQFIVVQNPQTLERLAAGLPSARFLAHASAAIAVCGDPSKAHDQQVSYLIQDCSAATQNLLLAASMLGWGACWVGVHPRDDRTAVVREQLALPGEIVPVSLVAIGHPAQRAEPRTRYRAAAVHIEHW